MDKINFQDDKDIFGRLYVFTNDPIFSQLRNAVDNKQANLNDAFSWGQLKSKRWLISELEKINLDFGTVFLCAGWYATLAAMLFRSSCKIEKIRSFDIDETCLPIADAINLSETKNNWKFKAITQDIFDIDYSKHSWQTWSNANNRMSYPIEDIPTTIINTSCEHIENFNIWYDKIPAGKILVLQNNNFIEAEGHVNCVSSVEEFSEKTPMSNVLFEGTLELPKYNRYMRIGIK
jgi:hypothetical protein